ncbi:ATP synthase F0 subunit C [Metamycoplasma neophronis]|uniref:ATP synthase subunit c n=2 Tax=Metamycoplasma neophronis TaxID=872983 RepID=A0ABY2Z2N6_9BACT|nr:ATP synthase F0 subunit C [Metamycoplasma neophronis]
MDKLNTIINAFNETKAGAKDGNFPLAYGLTMLGAGIAVAGSGFVSIGQGIAVAKACEAVGRNPETLSKVRTLLLLGLAIVETASIYCLVVSLLLIFV